MIKYQNIKEYPLNSVFEHEDGLFLKVKADEGCKNCHFLQMDDQAQCKKMSCIGYARTDSTSVGFVRLKGFGLWWYKFKMWWNE